MNLLKTYLGMQMYINLTNKPYLILSIELILIKLHPHFICIFKVVLDIP